MKMIVGLGNPGSEYAQTRHNVGFMLVNKLAGDLKINITKKKFNALIGETNTKGEKVILVKPQTYMNLSGDSVAPLVNWYKIRPVDIVVIYDDMDLPLGKLRIRSSGGAGGHNGMKSIINMLGTDQFARMRIGIGRGQQSVNHVLGKFSPEEREIIATTLEKTVQAVYTWMYQDINTAMNKFNI